jgi:DNA polymerase-3 subunit delta
VSFKITQICDLLKLGKYQNVYFLQGEEPFYIDQVSTYIEENLLNEEEKGLDLFVAYGRDTNINEVVLQASKFPLLAKRQVVLVKEAQNLSDFNKSNEQAILLKYVHNPNEQTILCFAYKGKTLNEKSELAIALKQRQMLLTSGLLKDSEILNWLVDFATSHKATMTHEAALRLHELLGNNMQRLANEVQKLSQLAQHIDYNLVEHNVMYNRDFNVFEFQKAISTKDPQKLALALKSIDNTDNTSSIIQIVNSLFIFFSKIACLHTSADKRSDNLCKELNIKPYFLSQYIKAANTFPLKNVIHILEYIQKADLQIKGINSPNMSGKSILKELIFHILG